MVKKNLNLLKDNDSVALRQVLKGAFDPKIEWSLPTGDEIPYKVNDAPLGTDHTLLSREAKRLYLFIKGGDNTLSNTKRETLFIQMLEGLSAEEAKFLVSVVNKKINNDYKGFTANLVKEAFGWDDNFMKKEEKRQKKSVLSKEKTEKQKKLLKDREALRKKKEEERKARQKKSEEIRKKRIADIAEKKRILKEKKEAIKKKNNLEQGNN